MSTSERSGAKVRLLDMVYSVCAPQVLQVLAELDIAELLARGPATAEELAARCDAHAPSLHRVLRAGVMLGLLDQDGPRFAPAPDGELLRAGDPDSVNGFVRALTGPDQWRAWGGLLETVRTGRDTYQNQFGQDFFAWLAAQPEKSVRFNQAMADVSSGVARAIEDIDGLGACRRLVDIGGGSGALLAGLLAGRPERRGVVFDTPAGVTRADATLSAAGVRERAEIVEGDFFTSVPPDGDAYLLKHIVHDWDDEQSVTILRHCRAAMAPDARLYLVESVVPSDQAELRATGASAIVRDLNMMLTVPGRERTEAEFADLLHRAGLTLGGVRPLPPPGAPYCLLTAH